VPRAALVLVALAALGVLAEEPSCKVGQGDAGCLAQNASCSELGFDSTRLACGTCHALEKRLAEAGKGGGLVIVQECLGCCREEAPVERFSTARLIADASQQDRDQDLHDFIKRKAPLFPGLEVEYQEGASPAVELESSQEDGRVLRADVSGWKSEHLVEFLSLRLLDRKAEGNVDGEGAATSAMAVKGAWTAEVQSCSG